MTQYQFKCICDDGLKGRMNKKALKVGEWGIESNEQERVFLLELLSC